MAIQAGLLCSTRYASSGTRANCCAYRSSSESWRNVSLITSCDPAEPCSRICTLARVSVDVNCNDENRAAPPKGPFRERLLPAEPGRGCSASRWDRRESSAGLFEYPQRRKRFLHGQTFLCCSPTDQQICKKAARLDNRLTTRGAKREIHQSIRVEARAERGRCPLGRSFAQR